MKVTGDRAKDPADGGRGDGDNQSDFEGSLDALNGA